MAQGSTTTRVKVINPRDLDDVDARDLLAQLLVQVSITNVLLVRVAEAISGDDVDIADIDTDA